MAVEEIEPRLEVPVRRRGGAPELGLGAAEVELREEVLELPRSREGSRSF